MTLRFVSTWNEVCEEELKQQALTQILQILPGHKLVVIVHSALGALLQLLCQVVEEGAPSRCRAQGLNTNAHTYLSLV